jgi:hypothetical protein
LALLFPLGRFRRHSTATLAVSFGYRTQQLRCLIVHRNILEFGPQAAMRRAPVELRESRILQENLVLNDIPGTIVPNRDFHPG